MKQHRKRAQELADRLGLRHLNVEAGWFSLHAVSDLEVQAGDDRLPASNAIYLMLDEIEPVNYLQWLASDDCQVLVEGGPADYYLFHDDGSARRVTMGRDLAAGQQMIVYAPAGTAKAIVLHDPAEYLLIASVVTPAWSPARVRIGAGEEFLEKFTGIETWATRDRLLELIGPNFGDVTGGDSGELSLIVKQDSEIIFQGMQLSPEQALAELRRFSGLNPGGEVTIRADGNADSELVQRLNTSGIGLGLSIKVVQ